jgi:hypothetical protein
MLTASARNVEVAPTHLENRDPSPKYVLFLL